MKGKYAAKTKVPVQQSRSEIERMLERYGADQFLYGWEEGSAVIAFRAHGRQVRFTLPFPENVSEQETRQRWRALGLVIKAKLESIATEITTFEQEFLAHIVLPDGQQVGDWMKPQLEEAYQIGAMPKFLALTGPRQ